MAKSNLPKLIAGQIFIWLFIIIVVWLAFSLFNIRSAKINIDYSRFLKEVEKGNIESVTLVDKEINGTFREPISLEGEKRKYKEFKTYLPFPDPQIIEKLIKNKTEVIAKPPSNVSNIILGILPWLFFIFLMTLFFRRVTSGQDRAFTFGKSRAKILNESKPRVTFEDVAGVDEAKEELKEIIEFLKAPAKFQRLGGRIPKGVLLVGPPGTGKTLLAKAVAGEAGVPFLSISGSEFVEMFVGVGAARVRDLFEQAKRNAPCIVFIDEIDAVGRQRGAGIGGGHDEREQTLNQLLAEMDGFDTTEGIIIMAATNRPDILDPALLRPGRFDRQIVVDRPDVKGREEILKVHTKRVPLDKDVDLKVLARSTPGFSGADLANMVNEAALLAARRGKDKVSMQDFEDAKDKVLMGVERRSLLISEQEKKWIAYHEAGHALVSKLIPGTDPIHKVTIIPRGRALGVTQQLPIDDRRIYSKTYCVNQLTVMLGGRSAEEIVFGDISTGSRDDIDKATQLARMMVCEWGMSEKLGPLTLGKREEEIFLGREFGLHRNISEKTAQIIDEEIKNFVENAHKKALEIIKNNEELLHKIASKLLEKEILTGEEIDEIIKSSE
ncbi:MAG: ATP-dependent zinc metalloprotease FtsH [candidate division WOR-3 bacterium]|nr:ATP-dependent zinc metalloprotease FtsH [candidate division WOR-3 bacterium]MCX7837067.1 ATP-dependent zinc metalloprotease FtsH [candidate division WOR-3 bacterium]MDW8113424.1 ATP-dependent zinc metalloprotease FtsH [candidate division WOR-3 bacterium]